MSVAGISGKPFYEKKIEDKNGVCFAIKKLPIETKQNRLPS